MADAVDSKSTGLRSLRVQVPFPVHSMNQKTIKKAISLDGKGIHSGATSTLTIQPAQSSSGIVFIRQISGKTVQIPAKLAKIGNLTRSTSLLHNGTEINTIEHLLAAFYMTGITNAIVKIDNAELPFMDGASAVFIHAIQKAGIQEQKGLVRYLEAKKTFTYQEGNSFISYVPSPRTQLTYIMDFDHPCLRNRTIHIDLEQGNLIKEISRARTFGFEHEIKKLLASGLGRGGNLKNTVILTRTGYRNKKLNYPDECLRHKVLDLIGDLYVTGRFLKGHLIACRTGHRLDIEFLRHFPGLGL